MVTNLLCKIGFILNYLDFFSLILKKMEVCIKFYNKYTLILKSLNTSSLMFHS